MKTLKLNGFIYFLSYKILVEDSDADDGMGRVVDVHVEELHHNQVDLCKKNIS